MRKIACWLENDLNRAVFKDSECTYLEKGFEDLKKKRGWENLLNLQTKYSYEIIGKEFPREESFYDKNGKRIRNVTKKTQSGFVTYHTFATEQTVHSVDNVHWYNYNSR